MNHENIQNVIDWLNAGAPEMAFSMAYALTTRDNINLEDGAYLSPKELAKLTTGQCGSVCCIAGAAAQFGGKRPEEELDWDEIQDAALEYFGIDPTDYFLLPVFDPDAAPPNCGPKTAAKALALWAQYAEQDLTFNPWLEICDE